MSRSSASDDSNASEANRHETAARELQPRDQHRAVRDDDGRDWFGAFYIPRHAPAPAGSEWLADTPEEPRMRARENATEEHVKNCISCGTPTKDLRRLGCGHLWCRACLQARIELALQWEGNLNWPARCCHKIDAVEMKNLASFVGESIIHRYLNKYDELETPRHQRIYCSNPRCSAFLGQRGTELQFGSCLECDNSTCLACGNAERHHKHDKCPSETTRESHQELISLGKLQQCPGCPEVVELREACHHIT
jgi:hypothetical protein